MSAEEGEGSYFECVHVKSPEDRSAIKTGGWIRSGCEVVMVNFSLGAIAGMEVGGNFLCIEDADVGREEGVCRKSDAGKRKGH